MTDVAVREVYAEDVDAPGNYVAVWMHEAENGPEASIEGGRYGAARIDRQFAFGRGSRNDAIQHVRNGMAGQGVEDYEIRVVTGSRRV